jgi:hypothetical protein
VFTSCAEKGNSAKSKIEKRDLNDPAFSSRYICPMHCKGSGSDQPGVCPVCEMDYELNEDFKENLPAQ